MMETLSELFVHTLQDVYYAENKITKSMLKVIEKVDDKKLKAGLKDHLKETREQIKILDKVFKAIGQKPKSVKCDAIEGLIKECEGVLKDAKGPVAQRHGVIGCCQAIEHYEIARYGALREWAKALKEGEAHDLLTQIIDQEKAANSKLNHLAVTDLTSKSFVG